MSCHVILLARLAGPCLIDFNNLICMRIQRLAFPLNLSAGCILVGSPSQASPKLYVLFIIADDLRAELATYGSPAHTPNLNRLAQYAVQFDHAYAQQALCNPSRSS